MASKTFNRSGSSNLVVNPSPETMYHFPISPGEPGKFDFYRVHLANHAYYSDSTSDNTDAPTLSAPMTSSTVSKPRWTPFADIVSTDQPKSSSTVSAIDSSVISNTNGIQCEPIKSVSSFSSLTDAVKNAMYHKQIDVTSTAKRRSTATGITLSTKDLNHLSPQSC